MPTYRAGIIGCGSIAAHHVSGFQGLENVDIAAIADPVATSLLTFGDRFEIENRYSDAREMLDVEQLDIVSITTRHKLHAPMTIAACSRKPKAVLCEKPMAVNLGECDEMMIAAKRNDVKLAIAHQRRFNPVWTEARNLVTSGAIGDIRQVTAKGGQGLLNDCSHLLDMMRYVMGDPDAKWVIGNIERYTDRYERDIQIEDRSVGIIRFSNGAIGQLLQELDGPHYQGGIFYGTDGILELDERKIRLLSPETGAWDERTPEGEDPHVGQARELIEWIEGHTVHRGSAEHGRAAVEIIMAIYESARLHEVTPFPVRTMASPLKVMIENGDLPVQRPGRYDVRAFLLKDETMRPDDP